MQFFYDLLPFLISTPNIFKLSIKYKPIFCPVMPIGPPQPEIATFALNLATNLAQNPDLDPRISSSPRLPKNFEIFTNPKWQSRTVQNTYRDTGMHV